MLTTTDEQSKKSCSKTTLRVAKMIQHMRQSNRRRLFVTLCVVACLSYIGISLHSNDTFFGVRLSRSAYLWVKETVDPWEVSVKANLDSCLNLIPLLLHNSQSPGSVLSWPTPSFLTLLLSSKTAEEERESSEEFLRRVLCQRYETQNNVVNLASIDAKPSLISAQHSIYEVASKETVVGDTVRIYIKPRDIRGRGVNGGGDFFKVRFEDPVTKSSVAASRITRLESGEYLAEVKTHWSGMHNIRVYFAQSGHFVDLIKRLTTERQPPSLAVRGFFSENIIEDLFSKFHPTGQQDITECLVSKPQSHDALCNLSNYNGESWLCRKPADPLRCEHLFSMYVERNTVALDLFEMFPSEDRGTLDRFVIRGNLDTLLVQGDVAEISRKHLPACKPGLKTPSPAGYWRQGMWMSNVCDNRHFLSSPSSKLHACLKDREMYFFGDSTCRQWYEFFLSKEFGSDWKASEKLEAEELVAFTDVWDPRTLVIRQTNTTCHYRTHGPPLQNGGRRSSMRYLSNELDQFGRRSDKGRRLTITIAVGPHFLLFRPEVFEDRMLIIQKAALRLLSRNPLTTIIVKGTSTFSRGEGVGECCLSDWLSYRQHKIAKGLFDGTPIVYLDVWDMTLSHASDDLIHPVVEVVQNEIDMALSFSCSSI